MTYLSSLENLVSIEENFEIVLNSFLKDFKGLRGLSSIGGDLIIFDNCRPFTFREGELETLNSLNNLSSIGGLLKIYQNDVILNLVDLEKLQSVGNLEKVWDGTVEADHTA